MGDTLQYCCESGIGVSEHDGEGLDMKIVGILFFIASLYYLFWFFVSSQSGSVVGFDILLVAGSLLFFLGRSDRPEKTWFPAKRYGYGWGIPSTWQGWVVLLVFMVALVLTAATIDKDSHSVSDMLIGLVPMIGLLVSTFIVICYKYGEKPAWRWGGKRSS
jgi:hypothetical protein